MCPHGRWDFLFKSLVEFEIVESSFDGECSVMVRVDDLQ